MSLSRTSEAAYTKPGSVVVAALMPLATVTLIPLPAALTVGLKMPRATDALMRMHEMIIVASFVCIFSSDFGYSAIR